MNRIIKFRAWHREKKIMITVCILDFMQRADNTPTTYCEGYYGNNERIMFGLHEVDLIESTGLNDKNGKEIFKGDVVYLERSGRDHYWKKDGWYKTIVWSDDNAGFMDKETGNEINKEGMLRVEIIGNIYRNPKLLTK